MSDLLERGGRDAVTTRAVAGAAGLRPPALYRLFGGKEGLPDAVAEYGFTRFLAAKQQIDPAPQDPVEELRDGWDTVVEFGPANPALYTLMYGEPPGPPPSSGSASNSSWSESATSLLRASCVGKRASRPRSSTPPPPTPS
ncbi:TetR/AcrR family transcriptional regulator [Streptomyces sp. NPDC093149]|uniref:TetR/AcrR family transcriptional regulator n=1 Tax=Streptomyces sp. NPDC093149 TaxID=3366031 RepID=UPI0038093751